MVRSMTGYGRGEAEGAYHKITVEMRSVNSRHLDVNLKVPPGCWYLEPAIRKEIQARLARGRVDVFIKWEPKTLDIEPLVEIHLGRARAIKKAFETLGREMGVEGKIGWEVVAALKELWDLREPTLEQEQEALLKALDTALNGLQEMREAEGRILAQDLRARAQWIQDRIWELKTRSPQILSSIIAKWKERVRLLAEGGNLEESRIEQEAAIWAEKLDITEELVRLEAHLERFLKTMEEETPMGKKMEFLLQELFREINTLGAKSQDLDISDVAISIKAELERMREQVQNLE